VAIYPHGATVGRNCQIAHNSCSGLSAGDESDMLGLTACSCIGGSAPGCCAVTGVIAREVKTATAQAAMCFVSGCVVSKSFIVRHRLCVVMVCQKELIPLRGAGASAPI